MEKNLISILTPCYNTGNLLSRLLDSILMQDYPSVEMYAIDDGSSDNTAEVIKNYIPKFMGRGYQLTYIYQQNSGQSAAINKGLKLVKGEFLVWPDSDDFFSKSYSLSMFVEELQKRDSTYGAVRCIPTYIDENTLAKVSGFRISPEYFIEHQFENCLYSINFFWGAGNYMIRTNALDKVNPTREIYVEKDAGQNWQMLLPILYSFKCITIKESLFKVLERESSHSRGQYKSYEEKLSKIKSYENTIVATLEKIETLSSEQRNYYIHEIRIKYLYERYNLSWTFNRRSDAIKIQSELKSKYGKRISLYTRLRMDLLWIYKSLRSFLK